MVEWLKALLCETNLNLEKELEFEEAFEKDKVVKLFYKFPYIFSNF